MLEYMIKIIFVQSTSQNNLRPKNQMKVIVIIFFFFSLFLVKSLSPFPCPCSRCHYLKSSNGENSFCCEQLKYEIWTPVHCLLSLSVLQVHLKNAVKSSALSEKVSMDLSWPFLFSSLAKAQIPKKILPFSRLKVFLCCLLSVNLKRRGLEHETACV